MSISATVVVPVLNGVSTIGDTLRSLLGQASPPERYEIIVVDNGSTDGTVDLVKTFPVKLLHCGTPGVSAVRNTGLAHCSTDIYLNADADTLPTRNWLREMLRPFEKDPATVLVGGRIVSFRPETGSQRYIEQAGLFRPENAVFNPHLPFVIGACLAVRREAAQAIGGWDETFLNGDDVDFSTRLIQHAQTRIRYNENAILFHRNRVTDDALLRQAAGYGYGLALIYRRYPERVSWNKRMELKIRWTILARSVQPEIIRLKRLLGVGDDDALEFARYHRMWTRAFWRGFFKTWRNEADH